MKIIFIMSMLSLFPMSALAQDFEKGLLAAQAGDFVTALQEWRPLADQGNARAQSNLGWMYENGNGVLKDEAEAVRWYRLAADQGSAFAQIGLGFMYWEGNGVLKDTIFAHMWLNISSANGSATGAEMRDLISENMTQDTIAEATRRARVCMASNYQDCD